MSTNRIYQLIALCICVLTTINGRGQTEFKKGYVITLNNDTLRGVLSSTSIYSNCKECIFRGNDSINQTVFKPTEIKGYRYIEGKYFISQELPGTNDSVVFAEFLVNGIIDLFYYVDGKENYYIRKNNGKIFRLDYTDTILYKEGARYSYQSTRHIGILQVQMADAPQLSNKIEAMKEPNDRQLIKLASLYHQAICNDNGCEIYRKTMPAFKMSLNPNIAWQQNLDNINPYQEFGLNLLFQAPRFNNHVHLLTGFGIAESTNNQNDKITIVRVPVRLRYVMYKQFIRPHFELGWSFMFLSYNKNGRGLGYLFDGGAGLSARLIKKVWLDFSANASTTPFEFYLLEGTEYSMSSYGVSLGLIIEI